MHLSLDTDYAVRCVLYLAQNGGEAALKDIGKQMKVYNFQLTQAVNRLAKAGLVSAYDGECRLLRRVEEISLLDIATAVEGKLCINRCLEPDRFCSRDATDSCPARAFYVDLQDTIENKLRNATIASLIDKSNSG